MKDYRELAWQMERIIHKYSQFEKKPQEYCKNLVLTQPEIHTVAIIGDQEGISVTGLSKVRGITKGGASQMVYKLVDKGLVEKRVSPNSDSELNLYLTKLGKKARAEHRKRHETMGEKFSEIMDGIPQEMQDELLKMLKAFEEELDKLNLG
ncbi:MarR family winged helix-turn-helix transcriptional regulator [Butyrivibrio sp. VCD2006]|uniref:MarR family winged helix-turn-helix transcriptional regulator n=1 Tax=Butyrivibrio sp. VCD2006 TaxID=1280664 RepID=UPI0003F919A5|nr:MarR family transcriptional regulator [Butyrivibrio sp. VCD2006]